MGTRRECRSAGRRVPARWRSFLWLLGDLSRRHARTGFARIIPLPLVNLSYTALSTAFPGELNARISGWLSACLAVGPATPSADSKPIAALCVRPKPLYSPRHRIATLRTYPQAGGPSRKATRRLRCRDRLTGCHGNDTVGLTALGRGCSSRCAGCFANFSLHYGLGK